MNKLKKLLAVLVCMAMMLTFVPAMTVSAEDYVEGETDDGLKYKVYDDHVEITGYSGDAEELIIPGEIDGLPVTGIDGFSYCVDLTSVSIPGSVTFIGGEAFYRCRDLTEIQVAEGNLNYKSFDGVLLIRQ